jgi:AcrR family transcriptional regulator
MLLGGKKARSLGCGCVKLNPIVNNYKMSAIGKSSSVTVATAHAGGVGRQQQRMDRTRARILDTASRLYQQKGIEETRVSDIIEASGLSRATFYRYFRDQYDILNAVVLSEFVHMLEKYEQDQYLHEDPVLQIVENMMFFYRETRRRPTLDLLYGRNNNSLCRKLNISQDVFTEYGLKYAQPYYESFKRKGILRDGVDLHQYVEWTTFILVALNSVGYPFDFLKDEFKLRDFLRNFVAVALLKDKH